MYKEDSIGAEADIRHCQQNSYRGTPGGCEKSKCEQDNTCYRECVGFNEAGGIGGF